jgi:thiamine biosynthesis lipoprotein
LFAGCVRAERRFNHHLQYGMEGIVHAIALGILPECRDLFPDDRFSRVVLVDSAPVSMEKLSAHVDFHESSGLFHASLTQAMGTRLDAIIVDADKNKSVRCWEQIRNEIFRLSKSFSKFDKESELYRVNQLANRAPIAVSDTLWSALVDCKKYHQWTVGYFDISQRNYDHVVLNTENHTVYFTEKSLQLDLGAYAKGYALERIRPILLSEDCRCALINFGNSSVLAVGAHPHGDTWPIGINDPYHPQQLLGSVSLKDSTLSTSGNTPNHTNHILNPFTGKPTDARKIVSVKANNAIDAEALSTTLMILPDHLMASTLAHFAVDEYFIFDL